MLRGMWTISEVCERTGLSPRTVRYYEEIGLLAEVRRREGGRRVYGADELERLGFISRLKALGLSLAEIRELNAVYAIAGSTGAMLERLHALLGDHLADVDRRIAELSGLRGELERYREHVERRVGERMGDAKPSRRADRSAAVGGDAPARAVRAGRGGSA
jgi:DNA-binding transcriptional MerR regulator